MGLGRVWAASARKTWGSLRTSGWTLLIPAAYALAFAPVRATLAPFGFVGGILLVLVWDALIASFLYVVSELVSGSRVRLRELPKSARSYFWPVMNFLFALWIARLLAGVMLRGMPAADAVRLAGLAVAVVVLSAVPEAIYAKGAHGGIAAASESLSFLKRQWIGWLPPNLLWAAVLYFATAPLASLPLGWLLAPVAAGALFHLGMVFRGHLFLALDGTTSRQLDLRERFGR